MKIRKAGLVVVFGLCSVPALGQPSAVLTPTPPAGAPGNWKPTLGSILQITQL